MKVKIICGISGSGKTTYIKTRYPNAKVVSVDNFFLTDGEYKFDPLKLSKAHGKCLRDFVDLISDIYLSFSNTTVIVDNTNTTVAEIAPYAALALAYNREFEIIIIESDISDLMEMWKRNQHGVSLQEITNQYNRLVKLKEQLPPYWPVKSILASISKDKETQVVL